MLSFFQKLKLKKIFWPAVFVLILVAIAIYPDFVLAAETSISAGGGWLFSILSWALLGVINFLGGLLLLMINLMAKLFSYNEFLASNAVAVGWPLVRDLCNMFFVVILLVIAFSTILNIANYAYKNTLFKLILAAILINFSKTILGFLIDFGQIIMITFVNAFKDALATNLVHSFGLTEILKITPPAGSTDAINNNEIFVSLLLGVVLLVVAIGVMLAYVAVLLYRIISLWVLVILSPLAFLLSAFPGGAKYASEFWSNFWKQLTTGVILSFFLWLSLTILAAGFGTDGKTPAQEVGAGSDSGITTGQAANIPGGSSGVTAVSSWERMYTFIVAIALLLLALNYAQQAGGFAGAFAGKISGKLSELGSKAFKVATAPVRGALALAGWGVKSIPNKLDQAFIRTQKRWGIKKPISFRPKVWKEAVDRYTRERETQYYTGVPSGMTDTLLGVFAGRKSNYQRLDYDARTGEKEKEISAAGELQEQLRAYLKRDHLEQYQGKNRYGEEFTKYRVKRGHENEAEAILHILTKNHDLNELFKDKDIGAAYHHKYKPINVRDMIRDLFNHQGGDEAARVAKDLSLIGFAKTDAHLYGTGTTDVKSGKDIFFSEATKDEEGDKRILESRPDLKLAEIKEIRRKAMALGATQKEKNDYQSLLDNDWEVKQGKLASAFIFKIAGRAGLNNMTAQMLVAEAVRTDEQGKPVVDKEGETSRSFLTSKLSETGKNILRTKSTDMTKEYHHLKDETKKYGLEPALDTVLQFVESKETDYIEKDRILKLIANVTPDIKAPEMFKAITTGKLNDPEYLKMKEAVIRRSQEARIAAHGDARHAEQDEFGNWKLGGYSVFEEYNKPLNNMRPGTTPTGAPKKEEKKESVTEEIHEKVKTAFKQEEEKIASQAPAAAGKEGQGENYERLIREMQHLEDGLRKASGEGSIKIEGQINDIRKEIIKTSMTTALPSALNDIKRQKGENWLQDDAARYQFVKILQEELRKSLVGNDRVLKVILSEMEKNFINLNKNQVSQDEINNFLGNINK